MRSSFKPRLLSPALLGLLTALCLVAACDVNPFDPAQQPSVRVEAAAAPVQIYWAPEGAQAIRVYRGATTGDGYGPALVWSVVATGTNTLTSGLAYGESPSGGTEDVAPAVLVAGELYTVQVRRTDPKGSGDGFTNTHNRYVGTATFRAPSPP